MADTSLTIADIRHPDYLYSSTLWSEWRETFRGGDRYLQRYLQKFSTRESDNAFNTRKAMTPIPTFAKAAILDVRNSIFQRLSDVTRTDGSKKYHSAVEGEGPGVDRNGRSMASFIGIEVLTEVLVMGRCGVYVDAPAVAPTTLAGEAQSPYLYYYRIEDILSWTLDENEEDGSFKAVLLRDHAITKANVAAGIDLPKGRETRYRLVWKDDAGQVWCRFYDSDKKIIIQPNSDPLTGDIPLGISVVPFVIVDIGEGLMTDISSYQKALLNLVSGDVNWALSANTPFLTIQEELRTVGAHLKKSADSAEEGAQPAQDQKEDLGAREGRYYDVNMDRPGFIAPPAEPLLASLKLQEKLEDDIRRLVNLAVINKTGSRTESAEAKKISSQGLEAGLSFIGTVLQQAEQAIARYWAMYENIKSPQVAKVAYPTRYILKEDGERLDEAGRLLDLIDRVPGKKAKKSIAKQVVDLVIGGKVSTEKLSAIMAEIEAAQYTSSSVEQVLQDHDAGLVSDELASEARGYPKGQVEQARKDLAKRHELTAMAQSKPGEGGLKNPASRGVPELDPDRNSGSKEQAEGKEKKANG
jgi:hypothetical protein